MSKSWSNAGVEPALCDMLADPIVVSLMKADRITAQDVLNMTIHRSKLDPAHTGHSRSVRAASA